MQKRFITANDLTRDSFRLAKLIVDSGWVPDALVALWRGGTPIGIAVHEFLAYKGIRTGHAVVTCTSYTGIGERREVRFDNIEGALAQIRPRQRVVVVDDIFDSGHTATAMADHLACRGAEARIATLFWKPGHNETGRRPDYYVHLTDEWVVFPHELEGLTFEEVQAKDPAVAELLARG